MESCFVAAGLPHHDGSHNVPIHDGRRLCGADDCPRSMQERGFCLVTGCPTSITREDFTRHFVQKRLKNACQTFTLRSTSAIPGTGRLFSMMPGSCDPLDADESTEVVARYQAETVQAVQRAFPGAELLVAYNQILRSSRVLSASVPGVSPTGGNGGHEGPAPVADAIAGKIAGQWKWVQYFPEGAQELPRKMLLEDGDEAAFLDMVISDHSDGAANPYALMPGASHELQEEVREILRNDPKYDFLASVTSALRGGTLLEAKSAEDGNYDVPAVNGIHSDLTEDFGMANLQGFFVPLLQQHHSFRARKYVVYHLNLWRNINPDEEIRNYHLAVLDKSSVAKEDLQQRELRFDGYTVQQYGLKHNPAQRWAYFPGMRADEVLVFQQGKCLMERQAAPGPDGPHGPAPGQAWSFTLPQEEHPQSVLHTAVLDLQAPAQAQRDSCENRFLVFVPVSEPLRSSL